METRVELYGSTGRMRGRRARARTARTCMTERAVFARPRGVRAAAARRPRARADGNSERGPLRRIRAENADLLLA
jgi:hypothetical protein